MVEKVEEGRYVGSDNVWIKKERNNGEDEEGFIERAKRNVKMKETRRGRESMGQEKEGGCRCGY